MKDFVVIGMGATGVSCVRYLAQAGKSIVVMDTRDAPANLASFQQEFPDVPVYLGKNWPQDILDDAQQLIVSPGIALSSPAIAQAQSKGVEVVGDIELFARHNKAPVVAITGSNGKSTVTTLLGEMAKAAGKKVAVIGNIGTPVLQVLLKDAPEYDFVVMELSSFQLETTHQLPLEAASVLNISADHMDRYPSLSAYTQAKHRIYHHAKHAMVNKEDPLTDSEELPSQSLRSYFTLQEPKAQEFGVRNLNGELWLAHGEHPLIPAHELKIVGSHNIANALAALGLGHAAGLPMDAMLQALRAFTGLPHRCQWVGQKDDIQWINDSKGTNIGACEAALKGIGANLNGKIVLLLGGDGKGADFSELAPLVAAYCRAIIVMGKDAKQIMAALEKQVPAFEVDNLQQAVARAVNCAKAGDVVLLSPACSSLDQFKDFNHRGQVFMDTVKTQLAR